MLIKERIIAALIWYWFFWTYC